jgi:hypothetical protein
MQTNRVDLSEKTRQITKLLKERCSPIPTDDTERIMTNIEKLLQRSCAANVTTQSFIEDALTTISRTLDFTEMAVALRDKSDGKYKYVAFTGMRGEAISAYKKLSYNFDEMISGSKFPRIKLDNYIDFFLGEYTPVREGELDTFNRPSMLGKDRESAEDWREGDYLCVYMHGSGNDVMGWIELACTMSGKLPSRQTFKWLELIISIISMFLYERDYSGSRR